MSLRSLANTWRKIAATNPDTDVAKTLVRAADQMDFETSEALSSITRVILTIAPNRGAHMRAVDAIEKIFE